MRQKKIIWWAVSGVIALCILLPTIAVLYTSKFRFSGKFDKISLHTTTRPLSMQQRKQKQRQHPLYASISKASAAHNAINREYIRYTRKKKRSAAALRLIDHIYTWKWFAYPRQLEASFQKRPALMVWLKQFREKQHKLPCSFYPAFTHQSPVFLDVSKVLSLLMYRGVLDIQLGSIEKGTNALLALHQGLENTLTRCTWPLGDRLTRLLVQLKSVDLALAFAIEHPKTPPSLQQKILRALKQTQDHFMGKYQKNYANVLRYSYQLAKAQLPYQPTPNPPYSFWPWYSAAHTHKLLKHLFQERIAWNAKGFPYKFESPTLAYVFGHHSWNYNATGIQEVAIWLKKHRFPDTETGGISCAMRVLRVRYANALKKKGIPLPKELQPTSQQLLGVKIAGRVSSRQKLLCYKGQMPNKQHPPTEPLLVPIRTPGPPPTLP